MRAAAAVAAVLAVSAYPSFAAGADGAEIDGEAFARVVSETADLRTGPGVSYRVIYEAHRGETFALDGRPGTGFWLRVLLPDGRTAFALGDEVQAFAVTPGEAGAPSRPGLLAPPPLRGAHGGLALLGGLLSVPEEGAGVKRFGYVEARPSIVLTENVSLEGFVGDGLTADGTQLLYGGGAAIYLAPRWVICPFVGVGVGGLSLTRNPTAFVHVPNEDFYVARAGGGLLFALRNRILVRLEVTNLSVFTPDTYKNAQTYSGGLGVYF